MDEWLSQVYGTGQGSDIEKTAQNMMLQKLAEEEGIDLSGLNDEELDALAQAVVAEGEGGGEQYVEGDAGDVGGDEELQAKFAEADFLGRVMAHAYTQELQKIASEGEAPAAAPKVCDDCGKAKCECPPEAEKTASAGPLARAIHRLGGTVDGGDGAAAYVEKIAEARAEELAVGWLRENGYIE
jgi:hypothetical protein